MLDYGLTNMQNAYKQMASQYDMEYADLLQNYFGMTEEQFNEEALNVVKQNLDAEMYLKAIAEKAMMITKQLARGMQIRTDMIPWMI